MSIKVQKEILEAATRGEQVHKAMHVRAQEMIELMRLVKHDALRRSRQYHKIQTAIKAGRIKETKNLFAEMQSWKKYKIVL